MKKIILSTINARYEHPSLGLRYLAAQMADLAPHCRIVEFASKTSNTTIAESLASLNPSILGLGIFIWNVNQMLELVPLLRERLPETKLVLGGPEISYASETHPLFPFADHIIEGEADLAFPELCRALLKGEKREKVLRPAPCELYSLNFPYALYSDDDLKNRFTYVEASRGCPFSCEFCLSSLDIPVRRFEVAPFLREIQELHRRGAKRFKFIDRTFNLSVSFSKSILEALVPLAKKGAFFHFEIVPDRLAPELLQIAARYPSGTLQFEVGIQSFNADVAQRIGRRQNFEKTEQNLRWLRENTSVHLHSDLIVGLPGEDLASFARGFDLLWAMNPQEIQVGILKKLRGAPIARHDLNWQMNYSEIAPYEILSTSDLDEKTLGRLKFFARAFELFSNRGRFGALLPLLVNKSPFEQFMGFSDWLANSLEALHSVSLDAQFELLARYLLEELKLSHAQVLRALEEDYRSNPGRKEACLRALLGRLTRR